MTLESLGLIQTFLSRNMFTFLLSIIVVAIAFIGGFYAGVKNANSSKVAKFKDIEDSLKK